MKRTLLAVGVAVLVSLMFVPINYFGGSCMLCVSYGGGVFAPFFSAWEYRIAWGHFTRQTLFLSVLGAVLVNLLPRKPKK
jgi:hypothetical protein